MKIVCLVYVIVPLVISIKTSLLNKKIVSLTYSQDHKYKMSKDCPTECYMYCIFMAPHNPTSLAGWVGVQIHAPDCACRSFALALCIWFWLKTLLNENLCVVFTRPIPRSVPSHLAPVPRREISGKLSGRKWRHSLVPRVPRRRPSRGPVTKAVTIDHIRDSRNITSPRDYGPLPGRYITDWHEDPEVVYNPGDVILRPYMTSRMWSIVTASTTVEVEVEKLPSNFFLHK